MQAALHQRIPARVAPRQAALHTPLESGLHSQGASGGVRIMQHRRM